VQNLELNELKLDYLTCTSNDLPLVLDEWTTHKARVLQYIGYCHTDQKIFEGFAMQKDKLNRLCRLSSYRANELWELCAGMRATRLDLALDVKTDDLFPEDLHCWSLIAQRKATFIETHENRERKGFTLYVGSRKSERFLRVYDKSAESNLSVPNVTRFELELKGSVARHVFRMVEEYGLSSPMQHVFRDEIARLLTGFELEQVPWFLGDRTPLIVKSEERDHATYLLSQIRPMLLKDQRNGYEKEVNDIIKACLLNFGIEDYIHTVEDVLALLSQRHTEERERAGIIELYERMLARNERV
jgi:hypothetical protein